MGSKQSSDVPPESAVLAGAAPNSLGHDPHVILGRGNHYAIRGCRLADAIEAIALNVVKFGKLKRLCEV